MLERIELDRASLACMPGAPTDQRASSSWSNHHPRGPLEMEGGTAFFFVTDGIESALERAKQAADGLDVLIGGGASVVQQYLAAGLVDESELHVVPILLGGGERLLDNVGNLKLQQLRAIEAPGVTHIKYRVVH